MPTLQPWPHVAKPLKLQGFGFHTLFEVPGHDANDVVIMPEDRSDIAQPPNYVGIMFNACTELIPAGVGSARAVEDQKAIVPPRGPRHLVDSLPVPWHWQHLLGIIVA